MLSTFALCPLPSTTCSPKTPAKPLQNLSPKLQYCRSDNLFKSTLNRSFMYVSETHDTHQVAGSRFPYLHILKWKCEPIRTTLLIPIYGDTRAVVYLKRKTIFPLICCFSLVVVYTIVVNCIVSDNACDRNMRRRMNCCIIT